MGSPADLARLNLWNDCFRTPLAVAAPGRRILSFLSCILFLVSVGAGNSWGVFFFPTHFRKRGGIRRTTVELEKGSEAWYWAHCKIP
jgi:hypothetical protein